MTTPWTFRLEGNGPYALLRKVDDFGFETFDLLRPPGRFWSDGTPSPATVALSVDSRRAQALPAPADLLANLPAGDGWRQMTRRSLARLQAWFLVCEDPQRRLDVQAVETLAHQASLVQHVLLSPQLQRVLIADEVGLGKTVEAGLIVGAAPGRPAWAANSLSRPCQARRQRTAGVPEARARLPLLDLW